KMRWKVQERLIPGLFAIFHFLERYPYEAVRYLGSVQQTLSSPQTGRVPGLDSYAVESGIVSSRTLFSDQLMSATHHVFQILVQFVCYIMRFPTYRSGIELSLRGHVASRCYKPLELSVEGHV